MKLQKILRWILFWLAVGAMPTWAYALTVTVRWGTGPADFVTLEGAATVNLDADSPVGAPRAYGPFTIGKCQNCQGRARVFVSDGDIDRLILTDAQITNTSGAIATLRIEVSSGGLTVSGPPGMYPYAVELSGSFVPPVGQSAITPTGNVIRVRSQACSGESCTTIDSPEVDAGEDGEGPNFSVVAPPYLVAGTSNYGPKEYQNIECSGFFVNSEDGEGSTESCLPSLEMRIDVTLRSRHAARLPGSIGAFHVGERCEPDNGLLAGCEKLADLFASLGAKGFRVQEIRLEPSPGADRTLDFRFWAENSTQAWRTHRDNSNGEGINSSSTIATLDSNGTGELRAKGLCPVDGCLPAGTMLPVRLFCGQESRSTTAVRLDGKGDGKAELAFGVPCMDPGVIVMDEDDGAWVAAPLIK